MSLFFLELREYEILNKNNLQNLHVIHYKSILNTVKIRLCSSADKVGRFLKQFI